jgi:hypothetical protein
MGIVAGVSDPGAMPSVVLGVQCRRKYIRQLNPNGQFGKRKGRRFHDTPALRSNRMPKNE